MTDQFGTTGYMPSAMGANKPMSVGMLNDIMSGVTVARSRVELIYNRVDSIADRLFGSQPATPTSVGKYEKGTRDTPQPTLHDVVEELARLDASINMVVDQLEKFARL